jgi:hypothetical protein
MPSLRLVPTYVQLPSCSDERLLTPRKNSTVTRKKSPIFPTSTEKNQAYQLCTFHSVTWSSYLLSESNNYLTWLKYFQNGVHILSWASTHFSSIGTVSQFDDNQSYCWGPLLFVGTMFSLLNRLLLCTRPRVFCGLIGRTTRFYRLLQQARWTEDLLIITSCKATNKRKQNSFCLGFHPNTYIISISS